MSHMSALVSSRAAVARTASAARRWFRSGPPRLNEQNAVFDRELKRRQREWAFNLPESDYYDYLKKEAAARLVDRIEDISRSFPLAMELGCHRGHVYDLLNAAPGLDGRGGIGGVELLVQCDNIASAVRQATVLPRPAPTSDAPSSSSVSTSSTSSGGGPHVHTYSVLADEEFLPFKDGQFDMVISSMGLHWVNDLPGTLRQARLTPALFRSFTKAPHLLPLPCCIGRTTSPAH